MIDSRSKDEAGANRQAEPRPEAMARIALHLTPIMALAFALIGLDHLQSFRSVRPLDRSLPI